MSTPTDLPRVASRARQSVVLRIFCVLCGLAAIAWGTASFPIFRAQAAIENTARRILRGEAVPERMLVAQTDAADAAESSWYCRPAALRHAALLRLRLAEVSARGPVRGGNEGRLEEFARTVRASLACTPSDPFLWFALYWAELNRHGFKTSYLDYLRMSYRLGPNEGWMMLKRSPLALAVFEELPDDLADTAIAEFAKIVNAPGPKREAVAIFAGSGPRVRQQLIPALASVAPRNRQAFADALRAAGHVVVIPGTDTRESRPRS